METTDSTSSLTTYTVKHKQAQILWQFKYDLNGHLRAFEVQDNPLSKTQVDFLFANQNFPVTERMMKEVWMKQKKSAFEIIVGEPDLSFDAFWNAYNHKVKKVVSERAWNRLSKKDRMDALKAIKSYEGYLHRKGIAKAHPATYLNQRYWEDSFGSVH